MIELGAVVAGSFLSSAHCVGMCGGLAAAVGATRPTFWPAFGRQLIYTAGRVFTYAFLGTIGGFAGQSLGRHDFALVTAQQIFSILAGIIMVFVGLSSLGVIPKRHAGGIGFIAQAWASIFRQFLTTRGQFGYLLAGIATGFLPCGLVYAFLALAIARGNPVDGFLWMTAFGIGTAPAMIAIGCGSHLMTRGARVKMLKAAACAMILMGGTSIYRAIPREKSCCAPGHAAFKL